MESKYGFTKMSLEEFISWISVQRLARTILNVQQHHTWIPSYAHFDGKNHFDRQLAMKNHHVGMNGWADIGQHFTIFPDGSILTGRSMERVPACITGQNAFSICIENLGNFDTDGDTMTLEQRESIIQVTAALCKKFNLQVNTNCILYHHWFQLGTGVRNNGAGGNKSCPGTAFFGGNKVADCEEYFLPFVRKALGGNPLKTENPELSKHLIVTNDRLFIRQGPSGQEALAQDRDPALLGAILRVYGEKDGWYKISNSQSHWVFGRHTQEVIRAAVNANTLNVRSGPSTSFPKIGAVAKGEEVFLVNEKKGWCQISLDEKWVSKQFLDIN
ncbi:SH3 domain-containing protein [Pararhodonellum marinum]|uniref:SH3 domain-containing protein n=1 Tax=Pararhodonellum marinum TaxID=2755358 RepID=UPI00188FAA81|nr:SH3 domain-containing protein [Pararhodonellum marinum]